MSASRDYPKYTNICFLILRSEIAYTTLITWWNSHDYVTHMLVESIYRFGWIDKYIHTNEIMCAIYQIIHRIDDDIHSNERMCAIHQIIPWIEDDMHSNETTCALYQIIRWIDNTRRRKMAIYKMSIKKSWWCSLKGRMNGKLKVLENICLKKILCCYIYDWCKII